MPSFQAYDLDATVQSERGSTPRKKNLHSINEYGIHMSSKYFEENGYIIDLAHHTNVFRLS